MFRFSNRNIYLIIIIICLTCRVSFARSLVKNKDIQWLIKTLVSEKKVPSIALAIIDKRHINFYCEGQASPEIPATPDVVYSIGSVTKTFTAISFLKIAIENKINMHEPACRIMSSVCTFPMSESKKKELDSITYYGLMTHTSGLPRLPDNFSPKDPLQPYADYSVFNFFDFINKFRPVSNPEYEYSNLGAGLLGWITGRLEYAKGLYSEPMTYECILRKHILDPLKMNNTFIMEKNDSKKENSLKNKAFIYAAGSYKGQSVPSWQFNEITAGCGSIKSTLRDMSKYISFQINRPDAKKASLYLAAQKSHHCTGVSAGPNVFMGLGWHILKKGNKNFVWHNGQTYGFRSFVGFDSKNKKGVVILCNSGLADIDNIGFAILDNKIKQPEKNF